MKTIFEFDEKFIKTLSQLAIANDITNTDVLRKSVALFKLATREKYRGNEILIHEKRTDKFLKIEGL